MDKWIIIHPTHLLPNPFMTQPAHLPPLAGRHGMNVLHALVIHTSSCKCFSILLLKYFGLHFSLRMWSFRSVNVMAISHA